MLLNGKRYFVLIQESNKDSEAVKNNRSCGRVHKKLEASGGSGYPITDTLLATGKGELTAVGLV